MKIIMEIDDDYITSLKAEDEDPRDFVREVIKSIELFPNFLYGRAMDDRGPEARETRDTLERVICAAEKMLASLRFE